jgi:hypothetical protein
VPWYLNYSHVVLRKVLFFHLRERFVRQDLEFVRDTEAVVFEPMSEFRSGRFVLYQGQFCDYRTSIRQYQRGGADALHRATHGISNALSRTDCGRPEPSLHFWKLLFTRLKNGAPQ